MALLMDEMITQTPRREASPESITRLRDGFKAHITLIGQTLESLMPAYKKCLELLQNPNLAGRQYLLELKNVYEVAITDCLAKLDNAAILHADFTRRSDNLYRRTLLLQSYRVISESTKALFGFEKDQRNALWSKLTSTYDLSSLFSGLEEISAGVGKLKSEVVNKDTRDFASHYNWDTLAMADLFLSLDEDIICANWNKYLFVSERISLVISRLIARLASHVQTEAPNSHSESLSHSSSVPSTDVKWGIEKELLKPNLVNVIHSTYKETAGQLDKCISLCRQYKDLCDFAEKYAPNILEDFALERNQKVLNAVGILSFMTNEAHVAAIALTDSSSFWESRMHLKRLDVASYEALDKIVGFSIKSKRESLFQMLDDTITALPTMVQERYAALKEETESLIKKYNLHHSERRCSFVHYRTKKQLWLAQAYDNLLSISVPEALVKVIEIRNLTTSIIRFMTIFTGACCQLETQQFNQRIRNQFQRIRDYISKIKDADVRNSSLQTLDSMQNEMSDLRAKDSYKP